MNDYSKTTRKIKKHNFLGGQNKDYGEDKSSKLLVDMLAPQNLDNSVDSSSRGAEDPDAVAAHYQDRAPRTPATQAAPLERFFKERKEQEARIAMFNPENNVPNPSNFEKVLDKRDDLMHLQQKFLAS